MAKLSWCTWSCLFPSQPSDIIEGVATWPALWIPVSVSYSSVRFDLIEEDVSMRSTGKSRGSFPHFPIPGIFGAEPPGA
eukprot:1149242-Pelagomonas_calceolata.AAC.1